MWRPRLPEKPTQYIYGDESGGFKNEPYFLLCRDVIDYFIACRDLEYRSLLIPTVAYDLRRYRLAGERFIRPRAIVSYNYRYKQIIRNNASERDDLVIILDERTRAKDDNLATYLKREIPNIKDVELVNSQQHNLVQLADLLTGCIYGDLTNNTHPVKRSIIEHLRTRLGIQRLHDTPLRLRRKFRVYQWRPPKRG